MTNYQEIINAGYRVVSRKHRLVARVDRKDWREYMAQKHSPWSLEQGRNWVQCLGDSAPDFYRRVHSKDQLTVSAEMLKKIPNSSWDIVEYVDQSKDSTK